MDNIPLWTVHKACRERTSRSQRWQNQNQKLSILNAVWPQTPKRQAHFSHLYFNNFSILLTGKKNTKGCDTTTFMLWFSFFVFAAVRLQCAASFLWLVLCLFSIVNCKSFSPHNADGLINEIPLQCCRPICVSIVYSPQRKGISFIILDGNSKKSLLQMWVSLYVSNNYYLCNSEYLKCEKLKVIFYRRSYDSVTVIEA